MKETNKENHSEAVDRKDMDFSEFLFNLPGGIFRYTADENETLDYISRGLLELYGYTEEEFRQVTGNNFSGMVYEQDRERVHLEIERQTEHDSSDQVTYRIVRKDGSIRWVEDRGHLATDKNGITWFYVVLLDITEKIEYQRQLESGNIRQRALADLSNDIFFDVDYQNGTIDVFGDFEKRFGKKPGIEDFVTMAKYRGKDYGDLINNMEIRCHEITKILEDPEEIDIALKDNNDTPVWCRYQSAEIGETSLRRVGRLMDIHEFVVEKQKNIRMASHDGLTGLLNRTAAHKSIQECLDKLGDDEACVFVLVDVDNFKHINDSYGHPRGDEVLVYLANKMHSFFRAGDILARMGGDEFVICLLDVKDRIGTEARLHSFCKEVFADWESDAPDKTELSCSLGGVYVEKSGIKAEKLYEAADVALYRAKARGKNQMYMYDGE